MASSGMVWKGGVTLTQKIESTQRKAIKTIIGKILITMDGVAVDTAKYMREFIEKRTVVYSSWKNRSCGHG